MLLSHPPFNFQSVKDIVGCKLRRHSMRDSYSISTCYVGLYKLAETVTNKAEIPPIMSGN